MVIYLTGKTVWKAMAVAITTITIIITVVRTLAKVVILVAVDPTRVVHQRVRVAKRENANEMLNQVTWKKLDSMYYGNEKLNVFVKSNDQIMLRLLVPGFSFQRNENAISKMIKNFGDICDVDNIVSNQMNYLFDNSNAMNNIKTDEKWDNIISNN